MDTILIQSKNSHDIELISEIVKKMGLKSLKLTENQLEDFGLSLLMKQSDVSKTVSRSSIMDKLDQK